MLLSGIILVVWRARSGAATELVFAYDDIGVELGGIGTSDRRLVTAYVGSAWAAACGGQRIRVGAAKGARASGMLALTLLRSLTLAGLLLGDARVYGAFETLDS